MLALYDKIIFQVTQKTKVFVEAIEFESCTKIDSSVK